MAASVELPVVPGVSVGPFHLGMPIRDGIAVLQENFAHLHVDLQYCEESPLSEDMVLKVPELGVSLRFDGVSQRLRLIDVHDLTAGVLSYQSAVVASSAVPPTFVKVYHLFGPTFPGSVDSKHQTYLLHYRGVSFAFSVPAEYHHLYAATNELPMELPDGSTPIAKRMFVYRGLDLNKPELPSATDGYYMPIQVHMKVKSPPCLVMSGDKILEFGSCVQDIMSVLGAPERVFGKWRSRMKIHSQSASKPDSDSASTGSSDSKELDSQTDRRIAAVTIAGSMADYYLNYFALGVDILIDGVTSTMKKLVLHTNMPGHPHFNMYSKCNFSIVVFDTDGSLRSTPVTANMKWDAISSELGSVGRPMIHTHDRTCNPFHPTMFYAYAGLVFEVMKSGHIASVTIFTDSSS